MDRGSDLTETAPRASPGSRPAAATGASRGRSTADLFDREARGAVARMTGGLSVLGLAGAWQDWAQHLAAAPGTQLRLAQAALELGARQALSGGAPEPETEADPRFRAPAWRRWPFSAYAAGFQAVEQWWRKATLEVPGVEAQHGKVAAFASRQLLDVFSPSNFLLTNPEALARTWASGGANLVEGAMNVAADLLDRKDERREEDFRVGRDVAITPGKVVARTPLAEILQYEPATPKVRPEPLVIVPAPIMKYYILDLTPEDSLARALVAQGFTVFMISWKNPGPAERECGFDDYRHQGVMAAIHAACRITGAPKVHAVGYCLGGTLLAMTAAAMGRDGDDRIGDLTLLASQADFTEAGELSVFVNESQVSLLEDLMRDRGYLRAEQMTGAFQILRANDLIWSRMIRGYLMGEPRQRRALDAWSEDSTRLPRHLQAENLRNLYLQNDFAEGRFLMGGRPVALRDIDREMFVLATEFDHVAPWRSVYKFLLLCETDITFALTNRGHNMGVICPPGRPDRRFRVRRQATRDAYLDPGAWLAEATPMPGSWWLLWFEWLKARSGAPVEPPPCVAGPGLGDAPGRYVLEG